jgi:hypothetical protein
MPPRTEYASYPLAASSLAAEAERTPEAQTAITGRVFWMPAVLVCSRSRGTCLACGARPVRHSWADLTSMSMAPEPWSSYAWATEIVL